MVAIEERAVILEPDGLKRDEVEHAACTLVSKCYHRIEEPTKSNGTQRK